MLVPSIINAEFQAPLKCRLSLQSPAFSRSQLENRPLDSTKTHFFIGNVKTQGLNNTVCMIRPGVTVNNPAITSAPKKMAIIALR